MSNMKPFVVEDVESFFHAGKNDVYKVLNIAVTPDSALILKIAEGRKGGERKQVAISLATEELLKLAKICEVIAERQIENKLNGALDKMN